MTTPAESVPPQPVIFKPGSLIDLAEAVRRPHTLRIGVRAGEQDVQGYRTIEVQVRALMETEWAGVMKIGADLRPPAKMKAGPSGKDVADGFNEDDPGYIAEVTKAANHRRAHALSIGLVGLEMPGETVEAKDEWLRGNLPPNVVDSLYEAIRTLTARPLELAHFISPGG